MNTDSHLATGFSSLAKTLKPLTAKSMTLSLALFLGACAATGDKPAETNAAETVKAEKQTEKQPEKQTESVSEDSGPTAAELMKTLRAPLKEPEPAKVQAAPVKAEAKPKKEVATKVVEKVVEKPVEKIEAAPVATKSAVSKELEQKTAAVSPAVAKTDPAPVAKNPAEVAAKAAEMKTSQTAEPAEKQETGPVSNAQAFSASAKKLPFTYDIWTIRKGNTTLTEGLVITTPTWEMGKEGYMSQIWLTLMEDKIHVNSSSDIETASKGLGIRIDGGDLIPFSSIAETNIGVIEGRWLDRLAQANKIDIYLGFFPGKKPTSDTFTSELGLANLARIVATYRNLNQ